MNMLRFIRTSLVIVCGVAISSCSVLSPVQVGPTTTYILSAVPESTTSHSSRNVSVMVALPEAGPIYNTAEMAYTTKPYQISYFVKNSWVESPAQMLQPLIVQTLQNTHSFHAVNSSLTMGHVDYIVSTQLLQFEQDFTQPQSVFRLKLRVQLINATSNRSVLIKDISIVEPAPQNTPYGGVFAANRAVARALMDIRQLCLRKL
jgi:cholesterol transport system auxiliary component